MEPQAKEATLGERAAEAAATLLERRGYRIVERDWKCDEGGFDVVASRDGTLVLAQVAVREGRGPTSETSAPPSGGRSGPPPRGATWRSAAWRARALAPRS